MKLDLILFPLLLPVTRKVTGLSLNKTMAGSAHTKPASSQHSCFTG